MDSFVRLTKQIKRLDGIANVTSSKSETNRALIIQALSKEKITLKNVSEARDSVTMQRLLANMDNTEWDVLDAGTTMRFLTAFAAVNCENKIMTGSARMQQRPIAPLVDCLTALGAEINYLKNEGFPPIQIKQITEQKTNKIKIAGNISSQYISALLMIAPCLADGLSIEFTTEVFSKPYIEMTLKLMQYFGVNHTWENSIITVPHADYQANEYTVESDWSGASYWYSFMALSEDKGSSIKIPHLKKNSLQGDSEIANIMGKMGVKTAFHADYILLTKTEITSFEQQIDFKSCPDLAQTVLVVAAAKRTQLELTGLESLKIKETDRVVALQNELQKIGSQLVELNEHTWKLIPSQKLPNDMTVKTYDDHRMAMAFAPLSMLMDVTIEEPDVVKKSYPSFWEEVEKISE